jgi:hypothetical protein
MKHVLTFSLLAVLATASAQAEISYADILADPDNPALNQQFARERLAGGDAKAALAAVERVLAAEPTNLAARLFRAEILAALGADLQAEGELRALAALPLSADTKARVKKLRSDIAQRQKRLSFQANLSLGYSENDNATNWPSDNTVLLNGDAVTTIGDNAYEIVLIDGTQSRAPVKDDTVNSILSVSGSYDLGNENWRSVFISGAINANSGGDSGYMDGETGSFATGLVYKNRRFTVTPRLSHAQVENDYETRLGHYAIHGASVTTQYQAGSRNRVTLAFGQTNLRFKGDKSSNNTDTLSASFGWQSQIGKRLSASLGSFYQNVDARGNRDLDKTLSGINLSLRLGLARGQFLTLAGSSVTTEHDNVYSQSYRRAQQNSETEADGEIRADEITSTNISYLLLGSAISPKLSHFFFTLNHQASETDSNIVGFSQERNVLSARVNFSYRF